MSLEWTTSAVQQFNFPACALQADEIIKERGAMRNKESVKKGRHLSVGEREGGGWKMLELSKS